MKMNIKTLLLRIDELMTENNLNINTDIKLRVDLDDNIIEFSEDEINVSYDKNSKKIEILLDAKDVLELKETEEIN